MSERWDDAGDTDCGVGGRGTESSAHAGDASSLQRDFDPESSSAAEKTREARCAITAKQWTAVAAWSWSVQADSCAICKNALADVCVVCQTSAPLPSLESSPQDGASFALRQPQQPHSSRAMYAFSSVDRCTLSWGCCSHVFHSHCISRWLTERRVCPLCAKGWELYKITKND